MLAIRFLIRKSRKRRRFFIIHDIRHFFFIPTWRAQKIHLPCIARHRQTFFEFQKLNGYVVLDKTVRRNPSNHGKSKVSRAIQWGFERFDCTVALKEHFAVKKPKTVGSSTEHYVSRKCSTCYPDLEPSSCSILILFPAE